MAEKKQFRAIKGVRDILPPESALWNRVEQTARQVFETYNFQEIRLPIFEQTELFARSVGADTDIVSKEMYSFYDRPVEVKPPEWTFEDFKRWVRDVDSLLQSGKIPRYGSNLSAMEELKSDVQGIENQYPGGAPALDDILDDMVDLRELMDRMVLGESLTLRPEATASVVRAYIENGMHTRPSPAKLYYMGPMFRRERPQKGRYRQFYQIGAEVLGPNIPDFSLDTEVVAMLVTFFDRCGLTQHTLYINSVGCKECRPAYVQRLRGELEKVRNKLGPDSQRRIETNPLRVLDSKVAEEQAIIERLPSLLDNLCKACGDDFEGLKRALEMRGIKFQVNPRLVRGLDYYVRTTFEITAPGLGSQNAVCGGGRYDGLVELIGGPKFREVKGVGFAIGEDRLIEALQHLGITVPTHVDVLVAWKDEASRDHAETIAKLLRDSGLSVEVPVKAVSPQEGLGLANRLGIPIGVVVGPDEVSAKAFSVRFLSEGEQVSISQSRMSELSQTSQMRRLLVFRVLLERELAQMAIISGIQHKKVPLEKIVEKLVAAGQLPGHLKLPITMAMHTFNRLVHGQEVREEHLSEAVAASVRVLDELSSPGSKWRFEVG